MILNVLYLPTCIIGLNNGVVAWPDANITGLLRSLFVFESQADAMLESRSVDVPRGYECRHLVVYIHTPP